MAANNLRVGKDWFYLLGFLTLAALFVGLGFILFGPAHLIPMLLVPKLASAWPAFAHAIAAIPTLVASLIEAAVWGIVISAVVTVISVPLKLYERLVGWITQDSSPDFKIVREKTDKKVIFNELTAHEKIQSIKTNLKIENPAVDENLSYEIKPKNTGDPSVADGGLFIKDVNEALVSLQPGQEMTLVGRKDEHSYYADKNGHVFKLAAEQVQPRPSEASVRRSSSLGRISDTSTPGLAGAPNLFPMVQLLHPSTSARQGATEDDAQQSQHFATKTAGRQDADPDGDGEEAAAGDATHTASFQDPFADLQPMDAATRHFEMFDSELKLFFATANQLFKTVHDKMPVTETRLGITIDAIEENANLSIFGELAKDINSRKYLPKETLHFRDPLMLYNVACIQYNECSYDLTKQSALLAALSDHFKNWLAFLELNTDERAKYIQQINQLEIHLEYMFKPFFDGLMALQKEGEHINDDAKYDAGQILNAVQKGYVNVPVDPDLRPYTERELEVKRSEQSDEPDAAFPPLTEFLNNMNGFSERMKQLKEVLEKPAVQAKLKTHTVHFKGSKEEVNAVDYVANFILPALEQFAANPFADIKLPIQDEGEFDAAVHELYERMKPGEDGTSNRILDSIIDANQTYITHITPLIYEVFKGDFFKSMDRKDAQALQTLPSEPIQYATRYALTVKEVRLHYKKYHNAACHLASAKTKNERQPYISRTQITSQLKIIHDYCIAIASEANKASGIMLVNKVQVHNVFGRWANYIARAFSPAKQPAPSED